jgi:PAS domain S-box-containing protein
MLGTLTAINRPEERDFTPTDADLLAALANQAVIILEHKLGEEALRESEERFRRLSDATFEGLVIHDKGQILDANHAATTMFGYELAEVIGRNVLDFVVPECHDLILQYIQSGYEKSYEIIGVKKDGETFPVEIWGKAIPYQGRMVRVAALRDISERKRIEEQLRFQKTLLECQSEASIDGILVVSDKREWLLFNQRFVEMWGLPEEVVKTKARHAALQMTMEQLVDPQRFLARIEYLYEHRDEVSWDEIVLKDGRTFERYTAPVKSTDRIYYGRVWYYHDISARKRAEEALQQSEAFLRSLFECAPDTIIVVNHQGTILRVNPQVETTFGYTSEELLGQSLEILLPERFRERHITHRLAYGADFRTRPMGAGLELFGRRKDGSEFPVDIMLSPLGAAEEGMVIAVVRDITERKRAVEALRESEQRIFQIMEAMPIGVYVIDAGGKPYYANRVSQQLLGKGIIPDIEVGQIADVYQAYVAGTDQLYPAERAPIVRALSGENSTIDDVEIHQPGQTIALEVSATPIFDANETIVYAIAVFQDITRRKQSERALQQAHRELARKAADLEAANAELSQYASIVSHDLRTPLRAIHNYADFLREDLEASLSGDQKAYLDGLGRAVREAEELIEALLQLARTGQQSVSTEPIDLGAFLPALLVSLRLPAEAEVIVADHWPTVMAEPILLRQVLQNLILNGLKFNRSPAKRIELGWRPAGAAGYELFVRDNGIGIARRYQEQIFRPFQRLHTRYEYEGTGIGLAIVAKAVQKLRGSIRVESNPGQGSTFFVILPSPSMEV